MSPEIPTGLKWPKYIMTNGKHQGVFLMCTFHLSIGLQMISRSEVEFHVEGFSKGTCELGDKFGAVVRGDVVRNAMLGEDVNDK